LFWEKSKEYAMSNARASGTIQNLGSLPKPAPVRFLTEDATASEPLHWALRASVRAVLSPRAWLAAFAPERGA
jgi:hypothetical protein